MKKFAFALILLTHASFAQQVAVTFDYLPFGYSYGFSESEKIAVMDKILEVLESFNIKATMLITSGNMTKGNQVILDKVEAAGHQMGNHAHRHFNFNDVPVDAYIADIDSCKMLAGKWFNSNYFRYPMLRRGNT